MGMFDEKKYLTGKGDKGFVSEGDTFYLHNARVAGQVRDPSGTGMKTEVKLLVSRDGNADNTEVVFATNAAIVGQVERMDDGDRASMPFAVELHRLAPTGPNRDGAFIITLPGQAPVTPTDTDGDIPF